MHEENGQKNEEKLTLEELHKAVHDKSRSSEEDFDDDDADCCID